MTNTFPVSSTMLSYALFILKSMVSSILVISSLIILAVGLSFDTNIAEMGGPVPECFLLFFCLILLAVNEGFQVGVVSIEHLSLSDIQYRGYSRTAKIHQMIFQEGNGQLKRLFIGQSFMVVTCSFLIAQLTTFSSLSTDEVFPLLSNNDGTTVSNTSTVSNTLFYIFFQSGLPGVIVTVTFAQLLPSIFSKQYPEQFLNVLGVHSVIKVALAIERLGIVKFVNVIFRFFLFFFENEFSSCGSNVKSLDKKSKRDENVFFAHDNEDIDSVLEFEHFVGAGDSDVDVGLSAVPEHTAVMEQSFSQRVISIILNCLSFFLTIFSAAFLVFGIYNGYSAYGQKMNVVTQFLVMLLVLLVVFYCEGLKIAIVSTAHLDHVAIQAKGGNVRAVQAHCLLHPQQPDKSMFHISHSSYSDPEFSALTSDSSTAEVDHVKRFLLGRYTPSIKCS